MAYGFIDRRTGQAQIDWYKQLNSGAILKQWLFECDKHSRQPSSKGE
jgi:hypothetical protein